MYFHPTTTPKQDYELDLCERIDELKAERRALNQIPEDQLTDEQLQRIDELHDEIHELEQAYEAGDYDADNYNED